MPRIDPSAGFGTDSYEKQAHKNLLDSLVHDINQKAAILRGGVARGFGADPDKYNVPFPGSSNNSNTKINVNSIGSMLAAIAATTGFGALGLLAWKGAFPTPVDPPAQTTTTQPSTAPTNTSTSKDQVVKPEVVSVPVKIEVTWELDEQGEQKVDVKPLPEKQPTPAPKPGLDNAPLWNGKN
jgi:hypothetical protein